MKFTTNQLPIKPLKDFVRTNFEPVNYKLVEDNCYGVYESDKVIKLLETKIEKYQDGHLRKYVPKWEEYIEILKVLRAS